MSDHRTQLMAAAQKGDEAAYHALLKEILPTLRAFVAKRLFDKTEVEDAVQTILMAIHTARHTFDPSQPFDPWMFAIARYRLVDIFRHKKRQPEPRESTDAETFSQPAANTVEERETQRELAGALRALPERQRNVVSLLKIAGFSLEETAQRLHMSVPAVKVTAHRAYKRLKTILEEQP